MHTISRVHIVVPPSAVKVEIRGGVLRYVPASGVVELDARRSRDLDVAAGEPDADDSANYFDRRQTSSRKRRHVHVAAIDIPTDSGEDLLPGLAARWRCHRIIEDVETPRECFKRENATFLQSSSVPTPRPLHAHSTPTLRPLHAHSTPTPRPLHAHSTPTLRPLYAHSTPTLRPLHVHSMPTPRPLHAHSTPTLRPLHAHSTPTLRPLHVHSMPNLCSIYAYSMSSL